MLKNTNQIMINLINRSRSINNLTINFIEKINSKWNLFFIFLITSFLFLYAYGLYTPENWNYLLGYQGDGLWQYAHGKAILEGKIDLFSKNISSLGAPAEANWSGYPITEEPIFYLNAFFGSFFEINHSVLLTLFLAHFLAATSFWFVCRYYKFNNLFSIAGAIAFAFSHYIASRGIGHLVLTFCWHIPILLVIIEKVFSKNDLQINSRFFYFGAFFSFIAGILNPYYSIMFCQFLFFSILFNYFRKNFKNTIVPSLFILITLSGFLLMNLDTLLFNEIVKTDLRNLASLEVFALKIPELFLPAYGNPWQSLSNFAYQKYYNLSYIKGELWGPYLGIIGIIGFVLMCLLSIRDIALKKINDVFIGFWQTIWILIYSNVGGINLMVGVMGFQYLRATNRYSIFILVISLLFLIRVLSKYSPKFLVIPLSLIIIFYGYGENYGLSYKSNFSEIDKSYASDKIIFDEIEERYPRSKIFMFPIAIFPEQGSINKMIDYTHLRPYLHTKTIRYSYGDYKFRDPQPFQDTLKDLNLDQAFHMIRHEKFDLILINKLGYDDSGEEMKRILLKKQQTLVIDSGDYIIFKINDNLLSNFNYVNKFSTGWSDDEKTHIWSINNHSTIDILTLNEKPRMTAAFEIWSLNARKLNVYLNNKIIKDIYLDKPNVRFKIILSDLELAKGKNTLRLSTQEPPVSPGNGDDRKLFFAISNLEFIDN